MYNHPCECGSTQPTKLRAFSTSVGVRVGYVCAACKAEYKYTLDIDSPVTSYTISDLVNIITSLTRGE